MTNDNGPTLRVVDNQHNETKRSLIGYLREAIGLVENTDVVGIQLSLVRSDGDVITITSESVQRHLMVAAAAYQLFDVIAAGTREK